MTSNHGQGAVRYQNNLISKKTFIIDELSIILAFLSAIALRFQAIIRWVDFSLELYVSLIITVVLFEIIVYFCYDSKGQSIVAMDPIDNLGRLIKSRMFLIGLSVVYLFATQKAVLTSRKVVIYFMALSVVYGYVIRMLYRHYYIQKWGMSSDLKSLVISCFDRDFSRVLEEYRLGNYECVIIDTSKAKSEQRLKLSELIGFLEKQEIRTYCTIQSAGYTVRPGIAIDVDGYTTIPAYVRNERFEVFGINYSIARVEEAVHHVIDHISELRGKYICFSNVHTSVMARENKEYADVLNGAAFVFPDGNPIARREREKGYIGVDRVAGPDFMNNMFIDTQDGKLSHYFYGSTEKTLELLKDNLLKKYPGIDIRGMYSPPFRPLSREEDDIDVGRINDSGADIVWIGLGAPKQEKWMKAHEGKINAVMMGVGAGFDFHAGTAKRAPYWMQRIGLEWLFRLFTNPKRLFARYFVTNIKYIWYSFWDGLNGWR